MKTVHQSRKETNDATKTVHAGTSAAQCVKLPPAALTSHMGSGSCPGYSIPITLPAHIPGKAVKDGPAFGSPAIYVGSLDGVFSCLLQSGQALAIVAFRESTSGCKLSPSLLSAVLTFKQFSLGRRKNLPLVTKITAYVPSSCTKIFSFSNLFNC